MKLTKKIIGTFGVLVCAGLLITAGPASSAEEKYDEDTYGPEKLIVWQNPVPKVTFSHKIHTKDAGLECDACHDDIFEMEAGASENKDDFNMQAFAKGKYCGACHDGDTAFNANGYDTCVSCHTPPKTIIFTKPVKAVVFDHNKHVDLGFNCTNCHSEVFKMKIGSAETTASAFTMDALYKGKFCGACHDGEQAFASNTRCTECHIGVMGFDRLVGNANFKKAKLGEE